MGGLGDAPLDSLLIIKSRQMHLQRARQVSAG